jgi:hypothetical protein
MSKRRVHADKCSGPRKWWAWFPRPLLSIPRQAREERRIGSLKSGAKIPALPRQAKPCQAIVKKIEDKVHKKKII